MRAMVVPVVEFFFQTNVTKVQFQKLCSKNELSYHCTNALSFYVTKTVLVGPKWFWSDQIDLDLTIMIWSWPKWIGHDQNELVATKMNWSGPNCDFCIRNQNRRWKLGQQSAICWNCLGLFSKIEPDFGKIS